jgi:hypothetical protein
MFATYDHTQRGYWHWLLYFFGVLTLVAAWFARLEEFVPIPLLFVSALMFSLGASFHYLRIVDGGDRLLIQFGPLPLLRGSIRYASITAAEMGRSSPIDGWGIHWIPGRGWTYNIWGGDCVTVTLDGKKTTRIGTDDVENLLAFLRTKMTQADILIG